MSNDIDSAFTTSSTISKIDQAIAAAKARKAARASAESGELTLDDDSATSSEKKTSKEKAAKKVPEKKDVSAERAEKAALRAKEAEEKKAQREARREERNRAAAEKKAEREANRKPAHMSKIAKAEAALPCLSDNARELYNEIIASLPADAISALALRLQHYNRVVATERALGTKIESGSRIRVVGGDPRWIGTIGTVSRAQRIRCYVDVDNSSKELYLFTSDVELLEEEVVTETESATGTEG